jgi:hypothetical protein
MNDDVSHSSPQEAQKIVGFAQTHTQEANNEK